MPSAHLFAASDSSPLEVPKTSTTPIIDGKLDDPAWATALKLTDFKTSKPDFGKAPSQKTEGYMLYDSENLYFAFRAYDTEPQKIKASISKRDGMFADDYVGIFLDTFNNNQEAYAFVVNPLGIQGDGILDITGNLQGRYDMVWYSKGQMDDRGYTAEFRIPLKSIRFPNKKTITMGVLFFRQLVRTSEMLSIPAISPEKGGMISQGQAISLTGLKYKRVVELLPAVTHSQRYAQDQGALRRYEKQSDFGISGKVGLTSDLTLDGAYNPDFSQVESDAGQIDFNQRYALYFSEKRPFFSEGNEIFKFAGVTDESWITAIVHTRTIVDPVFGFKLNGKLGPKNFLAAIYSRDDVRFDGADPHPNFSILRFKHAFADDTYIGGFYTARDENRGFNRVAGSDGRIRLSPVAVAEYHLFGSFTRSPDANTTANGHALAIRYLYSTRKLVLDLGYQDISKNFEVDTGFLVRTGLRGLNLLGLYMFYPKSSFFQRIDPLYYCYQFYDMFYNKLESFNLFALRFMLPGRSEFRIETALANEIFVGRSFNRNGYGFRGNTQLTKRVYLDGNFRRGRAVFYDPDNPYQGYGNTANIMMEYQATQKLDFILSLAYNDFYRESDEAKIYDYTILRSRNTFQINKYLFLRAIFEYNSFRKRMFVDTLASFTYIPGTVVHIGYGSAFERLAWRGNENGGGQYVVSERFLETQRGFFFKVSYLWRL